MAKNKKWNKVIARIQALEDALAGLLSGKNTKIRKVKKAKAAAPSKAKSKRKTSAQKPVKARAQKSATARKPRKKKPRVVVADAAAILPQPPFPSL